MLGWLSTQQAQPLPASAEWIFLGTPGWRRPLRLRPLQGRRHRRGGFSTRPAGISRIAAPPARLCPVPNTGLLSQARAQLDWNLRHGFCSVCGHPTDKGRGGQVRQCPVCRAQHFPRTDPVVITVVSDTENDRCLLGQSRGRLPAYARVTLHSPGSWIRASASRKPWPARFMEEAGIRVKKRPLPLVATLAVSVVPDDRLYR